jgi:hypothetical protein
MPDKTGLSPQDVAILRSLGDWAAAAAASPANQEKVQAWYRHDEGAPDRRVMVLAEMTYLTGDTQRQPIGQRELLCTDPWARQLEYQFRMRRFETEVVRTDHVVSPFVEYAPVVHGTGYGLPGGEHREAGADPLAHNYRAPLKTLDAADFARLRHQTFRWDREAEARTHERLEAIFGGILPVRRRCGPWQLGVPITSTALSFVGQDNFMLLMYDNPEGLHRLMAFIRDDHLAFLDWADAEGVWPPNHEGDYVGAGSMGFTRRLPAPDFAGKVRCRDRWGLSESQESVGLGPAQYREFIHPYLKALSARFGRVYYGCCEPVHPILDCLAELGNLARVSVSAWADEEVVGRFCRQRGIAYSRKPRPTLFMGPVYDEGAVREHLAQTIHCARGCSLEIVQRDVYTTNNDPLRFVRWVELVREAARAFRPVA